jgi:hypothetical protein
MIATPPMPKNLRQQTLRALEQAPDEDFVIVHEALLHAQKLRLLDQISVDATKEQAEGKWESLPETLAAVRAKIRTL